jgi:hypothetical protein
MPDLESHRHSLSVAGAVGQGLAELLNRSAPGQASQTGHGGDSGDGDYAAGGGHVTLI